MELIETSAVPDAVLPVAGFRHHLRLGTGFADEATPDAALLAHLRAAIAVVEARTGKALLRRGFRLTLPRWRWPDAQGLPVAPVADAPVITLFDRDGVASPVAPARWRLVADLHRPRIVATGAVLPAVPGGGRVELAFEAGFGPGWADVPADLARAVLLLAAQYFDSRTGADQTPAQPVAALLARWMPMRMTAGGHQG